ncbi:50S ribosomal protein L5 [bacterium DOLZORAL124_38_8]|nr:MAG: 50S ribosomal protein L5 [bacterium DOLZORAL124_38_8]
MNSPLYDLYVNEIKAQLQKDLGLKNPVNVPRVEKVVVNVGMGSYLQKLGTKDFSMVEENVARLTGQKPVVKRAKMSVSNFKLREGQPVGIMATLRGDAAYNFLYKMINVAYPRVRDFRGQNPNVFDDKGNCTVGFSDITVFPEAIVPENSSRVHGVQVTIVSSSKDATHTKALLDAFGFPFKKTAKKQ